MFNSCRVLGGLLSSHVLIIDRGIQIPWYKGQLLDMAEDVGTVGEEVEALSNRVLEIATCFQY